MKILISAAETSSDAHGAQLLKALRSQAGGPVDAFGVGGPKLQAEGLRPVVDARSLLAMGFSEVLGRLPRILRALTEVAAAAELERPDIAVVIDYPDFHFRLAKRLKKLGVPVIYYIPPKVWVWRKKRVLKLKEFFERILCILPFEEEFYLRENVRAKYVGNPLLDELPLEMSPDEARAKLGLKGEDRVVALMPGSRPSEFKRHIELMLDATVRAAAKLRSTGYLGPDQPLRVLMPFPDTASPEQAQKRVEAWLARMRGGVTGSAGFILDIRVSQGDAAECLLVADAGLIKSGTSTLEAGLLGTIHSIVYRPSLLTIWIFRYLIRYKGPVGLVNLVAGWKPGESWAIREILCEQANEANLSEELLCLLTDYKYREQIRTQLLEVREKVLGNPRIQSPSVVAAKEILAVSETSRESIL